MMSTCGQCRERCQEGPYSGEAAHASAATDMSPTTHPTPLCAARHFTCSSLLHLILRRRRRRVQHNTAVHSGKMLHPYATAPQRLPRQSCRRCLPVGPPPTWFSSSGSSLSWLARDSSTKANSPPWDSMNAVRMLSERLRPKKGPSAAMMVDLITMSPTVSHAMTPQSLASTVVLMLQPVVTKNRPSSSVRKGLMSASTFGHAGRHGWGQRMLAAVGISRNVMDGGLAGMQVEQQSAEWKWQKCRRSSAQLAASLAKPAMS
jgi:hypothetical protein